jgi:hypothetical protein
MNLEFFELLYQNTEFCEKLGRMTMAAGRFESDLREFLRLRGIKVSDHTALGHLIGKLESHEMLSENGVQVLRNLKIQRNYLTHSLFDLFSARVNEPLLPRDDLFPDDVYTYSEKTWQLEQNLVGLTKIVEERITKIRESGGEESEHGEDLLFRP